MEKSRTNDVRSVDFAGHVLCSLVGTVAARSSLWDTLLLSKCDNVDVSRIPDRAKSNIKNILFAATEAPRLLRQTAPRSRACQMSCQNTFSEDRTTLAPRRA